MICTPLLVTRQTYDARQAIATHQTVRMAMQDAHRSVITGARLLPNAGPDSTIEKLDQFWDYLVRRLLHQPMAAAFHQDTLDIGRNHLALLDQERPAGLLA